MTEVYNGYKIPCSLLNVAMGKAHKCPKDAISFCHGAASKSRTEPTGLTEKASPVAVETPCMASVQIHQLSKQVFFFPC